MTYLSTPTTLHIGRGRDLERVLEFVAERDDALRWGQSEAIDTNQQIPRSGIEGQERQVGRRSADHPGHRIHDVYDDVGLLEFVQKTRDNRRALGGVREQLYGAGAERMRMRPGVCGRGLGRGRLGDEEGQNNGDQTLKSVERPIF